MYCRKKSIVTGILALSVATANQGYAADGYNVSLGDVLTSGFHSSLTFLIVKDDNIRASSSYEEATVKVINPSFSYQKDNGKVNLNASYSIRRSEFSLGAVDGLTDHNLNVSSQLTFDIRNKLSLGGSIVQKENISNVRFLGSTEKVLTKDLNARYTYGAPGAKGNLQFGLAVSDYKNLDSLNNDQARKSYSANSTFSLRSGKGSRILFGLATSKVDYDLSDLKNSTGLLGNVGITWQGTAKTTGKVTIGRQLKSYEDNTLSDQSGLNWSVGVDWKPRTYSVFNLTSSQSLQEGEFGSVVTQKRTTALGWSHNWGAFGKTNLSMSKSRNIYNGVMTSTETSASLQYSRRLGLFMGFAFGYKYSKQDATLVDYTYERGLVYFAIQGGF